MLRGETPFGMADSNIELRTDASPNEFEGRDLSRIPPRLLMKNQSALNAIPLEIQGLLPGTPRDPEAPLVIIPQCDFQHKAVPRYHTNLAVWLKRNGKMQARLRLRWDTVGMRFSNFASSPKVERPMVRL